MLGIVYATKTEASPLLNMLDCTQVETEPFRTWVFVLPRSIQGFIMVAGIGKEKAARATKYLVDKKGVSEILNAGICGSVADDLSIGDVVVISEVRDGDSPTSDSLPCKPLVCDDFRAARLSTFNEAVFGDGRQQIAKRADVVDMEGWSVAKVCAENNLRCYLVKGVSDFAKKGDQATLQKNINRVSTAVAEAVGNILVKDR